MCDNYLPENCPERARLAALSVELPSGLHLFVGPKHEGGVYHSFGEAGTHASVQSTDTAPWRTQKANN